MRELRAALLGMIGEGTREIQAEEQDEDVEAADFSMKAAVARHLHDLLGGDDSTIVAGIGVYGAAMEGEIVMKVVERNALDRMRAIPRDVSRAVR